MRTPIAAVLVLATAAWGWDALDAAPDGAMNAWGIRQHALHLTGLWSVALMSLAMVLATRPVWLETPLGGMDRVYRTHKWTGILAVSFAALHWLVEMSDDVVKALFGRAGRLSREHGDGVLEAMRDFGEDLGEWAIYALLAMLVVTLWKRLPFHLWRHVHRVMPVLYLMLAVHAAFLAPLHWWVSPAGALLAILLAAGSSAAVVALRGRIGRSRAVSGVVEAVSEPGPGVTEVVCRLDEGWVGHHPGQFAFVTFDRLEGAHPFTIASADRGDRRLSFQIKALGDYTRGLAGKLRRGQAVRIEGPYGRFQPPKGRRLAEQVWIAGGIGVTPFLAWLESLQAGPEAAPDADLHYCTRKSDGDPFIPRLEALCAGLPSVRLHVHASDRGQALTAATLAGQLRGRRPEIWFCGPRGFGEALNTGLRERGLHPAFHQEAFEMR